MKHSCAKHILFVLFIGFNFGAQTAAAEEEILQDLPSEPSFQIRPAITLSFGGSSNVARLQSELAGTYGRIHPSLTVEYLPTDALALSGGISADLKQFTEKRTEEVANERSGETHGTLIWFLGDRWEVGGDVGIYLGENRSPVQVNPTETTTQVQQYREPHASVDVAWIDDRLSLEAGVGNKFRDYSTLLSDRGNAFKNDFNQMRANFKVGYEFSDALKMSLKSLLEEKRYLERPADFTDGAPSDPSDLHPKLRETAAEWAFATEYRFGSTQLTTTPAIRLNKDRVFGAKDSITLKWQQQGEVPLIYRISWAPSVTLSQERFSHFRSTPEIDPLNSPLRRDFELTFQSPLKYAFSKNLQISFEYEFARKNSNYADSSYVEHAGFAEISVIR